MNRFSLSILSAFAVPATLLAQSPLEKAQSDLDSAKNDLQRVQNENASLRGKLYSEINVLDDQVIRLSKELRKLERDEDLRGAKEATLERIIGAREAEVKFAGSVIDNYLSALPARLHSAERSLYQGRLDAIRLDSETAGDDAKARMAAEIKGVELGIERLMAAAGGQVFEGNGLRNGESLAGSFALVGPSAYFSAADGSYAGVAAFVADASIDQARIIDMTPEQTQAITSFVENKAGDLPFDGTMGKAIVVQAAEETLLDTAKKGGPVGFAILGLGAVAMLLALFKLVEITLFKVPSLRTINGLLDDLLNGNVDVARQNAARIPGPAGKLVQTGVNNFFQKRRVLEETLFERLLAIRPKLDRFLPFLSLVAAAAPLMGLLGTVLGIIKTFKQMAIYGTGNAKSFSAGISEALITTAEGLVVAIPVLIVHGMLRSLAKGKFNQAEAIAVAIMNGTTELEDRKSPTPPSDEEPDDEPLTSEQAA